MTAAAVLILAALAAPHVIGAWRGLHVGRSAVGYAAARYYAAWYAASVLVIRDLIGSYGFTQAHYDLLTGPWRKVIGPVHPDDGPLP